MTARQGHRSIFWPDTPVVHGDKPFLEERGGIGGNRNAGDGGAGHRRNRRGTRGAVAAQTGAPAGNALTPLCAIARLHQVAADPQTLAHRLGLSASEPIGIDDLLRAARLLELKARRVRSRPERLVHTPMPSLAIMHGAPGCSATVCLLAQCDGDRVLVSSAQQGAGPAGEEVAGAAHGGPRIEPLTVSPSAGQVS